MHEIAQSGDLGDGVSITKRVNILVGHVDGQGVIFFVLIFLM